MSQPTETITVNVDKDIIQRTEFKEFVKELEDSPHVIIIMNETYGTIIISGKQVAVNTSKAQIQNKIDKLSSNTNFFNTPDPKLPDQNIKEVMMSSSPESWSIEQVAQWLESINMTAFIENFKQNEIDGSLLISDGLDDTLLKELIGELEYG
ncbi:unnamed protein product, partial [Rotaria sordida]